MKRIFETVLVLIATTIAVCGIFILIDPQPPAEAETETQPFSVRVSTNTLDGSGSMKVTVTPKDASDNRVVRAYDPYIRSTLLKHLAGLSTDDIAAYSEKEETALLEALSQDVPKEMATITIERPTAE